MGRGVGVGLGLFVAVGTAVGLAGTGKRVLVGSGSEIDVGVGITVAAGGGGGGVLVSVAMASVAVGVLTAAGVALAHDAREMAIPSRQTIRLMPDSPAYAIRGLTPIMSQGHCVCQAADAVISGSSALTGRRLLLPGWACSGQVMGQGGHTLTLDVAGFTQLGEFCHGAGPCHLSSGS